jgi:hypothetical protein
MTRLFGAAVGIAVALLYAAPCTASESAPNASDSPVRIAPEFDELWLQPGICRSNTFRELVSDLSRSDVLVFVQPALLSAPGVGGVLRFVSATSTHRILVVLINLKTLGSNRLGAIAILAHELRHALEVADAPEIRSIDAFNAYYRRHDNGYGTSDTRAARETGRTVRAELFRSSDDDCATTS